MYSPYDFKTVEEREGGKFKGTITFTGIDVGIKGCMQCWKAPNGIEVHSALFPTHNVHGVFLPGRSNERDRDPITITDEPTFRRVVAALNAVRDKLIAEHDKAEEVCWPDGQPLKTYNEEDSMESITVDGWTVKLLKPITLAGIIKCGNVGCEEFREEFKEARVWALNEFGHNCPNLFDNIPLNEKNVKSVLAHPKWRDFLVQHGFIEVKKAEPEFHVECGDVFVIIGDRLIVSRSKINETWYYQLTCMADGNIYSNSVALLDHRITLDSFREMLGSQARNWQSIYATKCRIKSIETEKA